MAYFLVMILGFPGCHPFTEQAAVELCESRGYAGPELADCAEFMLGINHCRPE